MSTWNIDFPLIQEIDEQVKAMKSHGNKLLELKIGDELKQIAFHVSKTIYLEEELSLMTFHDIRSEIEQKEIEAWYKLIRILTHEVMNSITPLSSLTETILMLLENREGKPKDISEISNEEVVDIRNSIKTIQGRSVGILDFVDASLNNREWYNYHLEKVENMIDGNEKINYLRNTRLNYHLCTLITWEQANINPAVSQIFRDSI